MPIKQVIKVTLNPSQNQLDEIKNWLIKEDKKNGDGFYCNWDLIEKSIEDNKIAVVSIKEKPVGFATWSYYDDFYAVLDIMEIKPTHRKKGLGKMLLTNLTEQFLKNNIYVIELQCAPASSEKVWKKLGFIDFPEDNDTTNWHRGNTRLYKILVNSADRVDTEDSQEVLHVWNDEPQRVNDSDPHVSFNLKFNSGTTNLLKPVIYPSHRSWRLKWINKGVTLKDDKIKYCFKEEFIFGDFLVINSLPDLS